MMLQASPDPTGNSDDLDLVQLLANTLSFFRKYGRLLTAFSIAGALGGFALYTVLPNQYESTLLLHATMLTNTEEINILENWNALLKDGEYNALAERLHCNAAILKKVSRISVAEIQKLYIPNNPNGFVVTALVKDNAILDSLSAGIVYGLENSDYIKAKLHSKRLNLGSLIDKVTIEINKLDTTKKNIEHSITSSSHASSSFIIDVSNINVQAIALHEKLLAYQEELRFADAIEVLHPFEKFEKPVSPRLFKLLVLGGIGGFAVGYLASLYIYLWKRIVTPRRPVTAFSLP